MEKVKIFHKKDVVLTLSILGNFNPTFDPLKYRTRFNYLRQ